MAHTNVNPIQKSSATTKVFKAIYEMIATGRYTRGQKLPPQEELARQFGVSRNTLREAVNQLAAMGLLRSRQGVGTVVEPPTPGGYLSSLSGQFLLDPLSVREFIEARICIERTTVRLAVARATAEEIAAARATLERQRQAIKDRDSIEFTRHDTSFHVQLASMSGNRVLQKFLETTHDMLQRFIGEVSELPGAIDDAIAFHGRVIAAIAAHDADRAEQEMVLHLFDVVRRIETNLKIDLRQNTLYGFNSARKARTRRTKHK
jgi:GntR family transcriptional regulator, transcriptional repressor for pyruvate dehydrogenase complex